MDNKNNNEMENRNNNEMENRINKIYNRINKMENKIKEGFDRYENIFKSFITFIKSLAAVFVIFTVIILLYGQNQNDSQDDSNGKVVEKNLAKAFEYYEKAANQGHAEAQYNLGVMYEYGIGVEKNLAKAFEYYEEAANQGHAKAQYILGIMYLFGLSVEKDDKKGIEWLEQAANQGLAEAQCRLGCMYLYGLSVEKDDKKGIELLEQAANQGHVEAQYKLNIIRGTRIKQDLTKESECFKKVAMVTDYGDITDMSFNQSTWEAILEFSKKYNVGVKYYKPSGGSTDERVAAVEKAIADGAKIIVLSGYAFGRILVEVSEKYPNVKFIAIDVSKGDILEAGVPKKGKKYDYTPSNWKVEEYCHMDNIYCAIFKEEIAGFLAGYVAVKLGYRQLGFLGGIAVPAVCRYGYGFVQGIERAAIELGIDNIVVKYAYGNQFYDNADITATMDAWFKDGTEIIFPCGGGIYTSIAEAASKKGVNGKLIGVDVDQAPIIDQKYGKGLTVTSAMKGLYPATYHALEDIVINGNWSNYAGKIDTLGLVSSEDIEKNYVGLPLESTQWKEGKWTLKDYKELVAKLYSGELKVDSDISKMPTTKKVKVIYLGNIK